MRAHVCIPILKHYLRSTVTTNLLGSHFPTPWFCVLHFVMSELLPFNGQLPLIVSFDLWLFRILIRVVFLNVKNDHV